MRATSCPSTISATAPDLSPTMPFVAGGPYHHHGPLPHRWHTAVRCHRTQITPSQSVKASGALPPAWLPILSEGAEPADSRNKSW